MDLLISTTKYMCVFFFTSVLKGPVHFSKKSPFKRKGLAANKHCNSRKTRWCHTYLYEWNEWTLFYKHHPNKRKFHFPLNRLWDNKNWIEIKAELPIDSIFFHTQFSSLGIFINNKVGNQKTKTTKPPSIQLLKLIQ